MSFAATAGLVLTGIVILLGKSGDRGASVHD